MMDIPERISDLWHVTMATTETTQENDAGANMNDDFPEFHIHSSTEEQTNLHLQKHSWGKIWQKLSSVIQSELTNNVH